MSEKSALRLEEAVQSPAEPATLCSQHKARRRARLYKAACFYFSVVMANNLHKYAVANSRDAQQKRWNELIGPVNARLSPWILLFSAPLSGPSKPSFLDTNWFFVAAIFSYFVYARFYYQWNQQNDRYQLPILIVATLVGLVPALSLNVGFMISVFCVTPKIALFGLLVSDVIHLVFQGPWQEKTSKKPVVDAEKGLQSDVDARGNNQEHVGRVTMQSDDETYRQRAVQWHDCGEAMKEPLLSDSVKVLEGMVKHMEDKCAVTHQARNDSSGEKESCECLVQIDRTRTAVAKIRALSRLDDGHKVREFLKSQECAAALDAALETISLLGNFSSFAAALSRETPRLEEATHSGCQDICCWHLSPDSTNENA